MSHVFVCYAFHDSDFASNLIRRLNMAGIETADCEPLRALQNREELDRALDDSFALLLVVTPEILGVETIIYEWAYALGAKKSIVPVLLKTTELPARLRGMPMLDFIEFDARPWEELIRHIYYIRGEYGSSIISIPSDTPADIRSAILQLDSKNPDERRAGLEALVLGQHPLVTAALAAAAMGHTRQDVRIHAALKLAARTRYRDERALSGLLEALNSTQEALQLDATKALGKLGDAASAGLLIAAQENSSEVRKSVVTGLCSVLKRENKEVRYHAALRLGEIGDPAAVPALLELLHDPLIGIRAAAAQALGKIGDEAATEQLVQVLNDEIAFMRQSAAEALGKIGDPSAVPALVRALDEWSPDVRQAAANALGQIGDASAVPQLLEVLHDERMGARGAAARALAMIGLPALPGLIAELRNKDPHVRQYTATALGMIGDDAAVPELVKMLHDLNEVDFVRHAAVEALVDIGAASVPGLILALDDPDADMRELAAEALELIGTAEAFEALSAWQNTVE